MNEVLIPALAALMGALIPTLANMILTLRAPIIQNDTELANIRRELGYELLSNLIECLSGGAERQLQQEAQGKLMNSRIRAAMYFKSDILSDLDQFLLQLNSGQAHSQEEFNNIFLRLTNHMRKEIGLKEIANFHVMVYRS